MDKARIAQQEQWLDLDIQRVLQDDDLPTDEEFQQWVAGALNEPAIKQLRRPDQSQREGNQLAIRIVDEEEGAHLNEQWRHKHGATNVLSFAMSGLDLIAPEILGDIVICAPVVRREANEQSKTLDAHWAHMVVHGVLHLLNYDHTIDEDAELMERLETKIMQGLGYPDPYRPL